ncbi:hypothetical protein EVG20_g11534, partial [Dentipellis fragilis]
TGAPFIFVYSTYLAASRDPRPEPRAQRPPNSYSNEGRARPGPGFETAEFHLCWLCVLRAVKLDADIDVRRSRRVGVSVEGEHTMSSYNRRNDGIRAFKAGVLCYAKGPWHSFKALKSAVDKFLISIQKHASSF